jgi:hypothetical protein
VSDSRRREQYVPLASKIAFTKSGTKLLDKWGMEGLCTWMLFLAACKRNSVVQGEVAFTSDAEGWALLGAQATAFTLREFFDYTGRQKMTSRRRSGRIQHVSCTSWKRWNDEFRKQEQAEKKSRKRAVSNVDTKVDSVLPLGGTEGEGEKDEYEGEGEVVAPNIVTSKTAVQQLIEETQGMDDSAQRRISEYRKSLPDAAFHNARESLQAKRKTAGTGVNEVGYVLGTLRSMVKEGQYERSAA